MVIRNNVKGQRARRNYGSANAAISKTLGKLSTGYRINSAADDAAGLAVSEKMRIQITGLGRAKENSQDGTSLIQTGEGALQEIHDMLNRAEYLAEESANGTYNDELDRENLQKELIHICEEIDRITASANFNGIELFQDMGAEYERSTTPPDPDAVKFQQYLEELQKSKEQVSQKLKLLDEAEQQEREGVSDSTQTQPVETYGADGGSPAMDKLASATEPGGVHIFYIEDELVNATQQGTNSVNSQTYTNNPACDIKVSADSGDKKLSEVLKDEIIPNVVDNLLTHYPAFGYLKNSPIGIGMRLYNENTNTLASVTGAYAGNTQYYMLSVNINTLKGADGKISEESRTELETTIAHEMMHAFMDEAATAGMFNDFPGWFVEGMAQTASGPDNWLKPSETITNPDGSTVTITYSGLRIDENSSDDVIKAAINNNSLDIGRKTGSTASKYGTGYLACMYLGAAISAYQAGNNLDNIAGYANSASLSKGLNRLMSAVIGGKSLDKAISELTGNTFTSTLDFQTKFNGGTADGMCGFVRKLLTNTGTGLGGLATGDLTATDLADNSVKSNPLFGLNTDNTFVKNTYDETHVVVTGGTLSIDGTAPVELTELKDFGDFTVEGKDLSGVSFDNGTLTVSGNDIRVTMKVSGSSTAQNIVMNGGGTVTLDGVNTSGNIDIKDDTQITVTGVNKAGKIAMDGGKNATFEGGGRLETGTFASADTNNITLDGTTLAVTGGNLETKTLTIKNGTVIANNGSGTISGDVTVKDAAVVAGTLTSPLTSHKNADIPWSGGANNIADLGDLTSITIDGVKFDTPIAQNTANASLLLDPSSDHRVTFTDGTTRKELIAKPVFEAGGVTFKEFTWGLPPRPFTVTYANGTAAVEGQDFEYDDNGTTLIIKKSGELTISGGVNNEDPTNPIKGRIKLEDNIAGNVKLNLNGCNVDVSAIKASAFDLGTGNDVTLNLIDDKTNTFKSGDGFAGISVGDGTKLKITGDTGTLEATGGYYGAGIGRSEGKSSDKTSSITIEGGNITAVGGYYGAGIGASCGPYDSANGGYQSSSFGNITINAAQNGGSLNKCIITANGGYGAAGIGGSESAAVGDISIKNARVTAESKAHGAGIGGGWGSSATNGTITIDGDAVDAGGNPVTHISASGVEHGTGIGAGCSGTSGDITIKGNAVIDLAQGGTDGAGIGASWTGRCGNITIEGDAEIVLAKGGNKGAGIGSGSAGSRATGTIKIDTTGSVTAEGGDNGVGIGSGYGNSSVGKIEILQGTVNAEGKTDATGIGAGRNSKSGDIQIGDPNNPNNKVIVNAKGGMTNNGGNILSYTDTGHTNAGSVNIFGQNTSVCPGEKGEGLYSTSGVTDSTGKKLYSYPLYINEKSPGAPELEASQGLDKELGPLTKGLSWGKLPLLPATDENGDPILDKNGNPISIESIVAKGANGDTTTWSKDITHVDADGKTDNYVYLWMSAQNQDLTITYSDGSSVNLHLTFYEKAGKFRVDKVQEDPGEDEESGYHDDPKPDPGPGPTPDPPRPPVGSDTDSPSVPSLSGKGGIILQIGANSGEIMEVPRFYLSARALGMDKISIATQDNALKSVDVLREAVNRVSHIRGDYGALQNRLEHNIKALGQAEESITDAESRIRDADMAEEYTKLVKLNILQQSAQAMMLHSNEDANRVLQLLQ